MGVAMLERKCDSMHGYSSRFFFLLGAPRSHFRPPATVVVERDGEVSGPLAQGRRRSGVSQV